MRTFRVVIITGKCEEQCLPAVYFGHYGVLQIFQELPLSFPLCSRAALPTHLPAALCVELGRQKAPAKPEGCEGKDGPSGCLEKAGDTQPALYPAGTCHSPRGAARSRDVSPRAGARKRNPPSLLPIKLRAESSRKCIN